MTQETQTHRAYVALGHARFAFTKDDFMKPK